MPQLAAPSQDLHHLPGTKISKITILIFLHTDRQRIMSAQIRCRTLLHPDGSTPSSRKPTILNKITPQIYLPVGIQESVYIQPDQTPHFAAPRRGLHHPPGNQQFSTKYPSNINSMLGCSGYYLSRLDAAIYGA